MQQSFDLRAVESIDERKSRAFEALLKFMAEDDSVILRLGNADEHERHT